MRIFALSIVFALLINFLFSSYNENISNQGHFPNYHYLTSDSSTIDEWPCFSPNGETILFSRSTDKKKTWRLFTVPAVGGTATSFTSSKLPVSGTRANWSWSTGKIAFTGMTTDTSFSIWLINFDGSNPQQFNPEDISDFVFYPSWYPDGKRIVVVDAMDRRHGVVKQIYISEKSAISLTDTSDIFAGMPRVSPDGETIAFAGQHNDGQPYDQTKNHIWIRDKNGTLRLLDSGQGRAPSWSPDGNHIAFQSNRGSETGRYGIFIASLTSNKIIQISPFVIDARHPSWSPEGNYLVFSGALSKTGNDRGIVIVKVSELLDPIEFEKNIQSGPER